MEPSKRGCCLEKREWDAQRALATLIQDLEAQARYGAAAKCRAVLSKMLSGDVAGALRSRGVIADASADSNAAQILAALNWCLIEEAESFEFDNGMVEP